MKKPSRPPVLAHIHVPKCAGTSFRYLLDDVFPDAHLQLYFEPGTQRALSTDFVYSDDQLCSLLADEQVDAFSSHHVRRFPSEIAGRPVHYVTFLRNPVQQFVSYLSFTRQVYSNIEDADLLAHLPPNLEALSLREAAAWLMDQDDRDFRNFRENYTTNFLALFESQSKYGFQYSEPHYRRKRFGIAKKVLSRFFFVGLSEHMEESWRMLSTQLADFGVNRSSLFMRRENVAQTRNEDLSWLTAGDPVGRRVLASMSEDLRLYAWASRRFTLRLKESAQGAPLSWWQRTIWSELRG